MWQAQLAAYEKAGEELAKLKAEKQKAAESVEKTANSKLYKTGTLSDALQLLETAAAGASRQRGPRGRQAAWRCPSDGEPGYRDWQGWDETREGQGPITCDVADRSQDMPSIGSMDHAAGTCRPCAWFHKPGGCRNSYDCSHCHLCPANAKRKNKGQGKAKGEGKDRRIEEEVVPGVQALPAPEAELAPVPPIDPSSRPRWSRGSELHGMPGKQRCRRGFGDWLWEWKVWLVNSILKTVMDIKVMSTAASFFLDRRDSDSTI
eukprot:s4142_g1.t1